ncbi:phosphoribosylglycinamide formyltransferase [Aquibacillus albus]|uniref:Phosphoribosylglycinamide formyltransferase n=1 Tax=Aquibacillus albus TaxID=1168171 RepID=A0ABS2N4H9_9BACI|nr:phosphoribosylglycinamide formyltransferase [Aquibacillus albus]MBM7572790.1 phosphoribosylglycinamide formyltransferase-1 [Aquibacillus albus]
MEKTNIAVFASGTGSNFETIVKAMEAGRLDCNVSLLVCDKADAKVLDKAKAFNIPTFVFNPKDYDSKADFEQEIITQLEAKQIEWIVLAGYMRLIGTTLLSQFESKIINIHPSLLPSFPGKDAIGQALEAGVKITGVTIHYVDEGMDTGKIIEQEALRVREKEDRDSLQQRIQELEHRLFPETIQRLVSNNLEK